MDAEKKFVSAAIDWVCDGYSLDIRYVQRHDLGTPQLWEAWVGVQPLPPTKDVGFTIATPLIIVGQRQLPRLTAAEILDTIQEAVLGRIKIDDTTLHMETDSLSYYSEAMHRERWFAPLGLQVSGNRASRPAPLDSSLLDTQLRRADPPFDGMGDLGAWLGLNDRQFSGSGPVITIHISPPVDLIVEKGRVRDDHLELEILAMQSFDTTRIRLSMAAYPVDGISSRQQIASKIRWAKPRGGLRKGTVAIKIKRMDSALVMLTVGDATIRRQWFLDPEKVRNHRLAAVKLFDKDLRMVKQAVLQPADAARFEFGIQTLLFLLGFAPTVMLERDAPDLIVAAPSGRLVLVECTTRIADFHAKLGKLIDRRGAAIKHMQSSGHGSMVSAALVCALPRDQIAASDAELAKHGLMLFTAETLSAIFDQARFPNDPDKLLDEALGSANAGSVRQG